MLQRKSEIQGGSVTPESMALWSSCVPDRPTGQAESNHLLSKLLNQGPPMGFSLTGLQSNLGSQTPWFMNNSVLDQAVRGKTSCLSKKLRVFILDPTTLSG